MKYDIDYFITKFTNIPEDQWCVNEFTDQKGRHCVMGHCKNDNTWENERMYLLRLFTGTSVAKVNDGLDSRYQQPTPKQRMLAALEDLKKV